MACKYILKATGLENIEKICDTALNGKIAVDMVKEHKDECYYDLILMDQNMPVLNGCMASKQIREYLYSQDRLQPIIVGVTGQVEEIYVKNAIENGMN